MGVPSRLMPGPPACSPLRHPHHSTQNPGNSSFKLASLRHSGPHKNRVGCCLVIAMSPELVGDAPSVFTVGQMNLSFAAVCSRGLARAWHITGAQSLGDEWVMALGLFERGWGGEGGECTMEHLLCVKHCADAACFIAER